jgi:hypothetical protein
MISRYSWNLIRGRRAEMGFEDLLSASAMVALYPVVIGALLALSSSYQGNSRKIDAILTVLTLGLWLSYAQKRVADRLKTFISSLELSEERTISFTI